MKKILKQIRVLLRTQYRLTAYLPGSGKPENTYSASRASMLRKASTLPVGTMWTLYKTGPICMPEREIMHSTAGNQPSKKTR